MDLLIQLKPSIFYLRLIQFSSLAGVTGIIMAGQPIIATLILLVIWGFSLFWALRFRLNGPTLLRTRNSILEVQVAGHWLSLGIVRILPFLVYFPASVEQPHMLIWKDSVGLDEWRQLRMWLKVNMREPLV